MRLVLHISLFFLFIPFSAMAMTPLDGIYPTILSPVSTDGYVDLAPLREQIAAVIKGGAAGIKVLGSVGEGHYLDEAAREDIIRESRRALGRNRGLIVGVTENSVPRAIHLARQAERLGANFISLQLPTFYTVEPGDVVNFVKRIVQAVDVPIIYYHYPEKTHLDLPDETLVEILLLEGVVGTKMTSFQFNQIRSVMRKVHRYRPEVAFLSGSTFNLLWNLKQGGAGAIDPVSLFEPEIASKIHNLYREAQYSDRRTSMRLMREAEDLQDYLLGYLSLFQDEWTDPDVLKFFFKGAMSFGFGIEVGTKGYVSRLKYLLNSRGGSTQVTVTEPLAQLNNNDIEIVTGVEDYLEQCRLTQSQSLESRVLGRLLAYELQQPRLPVSQLMLSQLAKRSISFPL